MSVSTRILSSIPLSGQLPTQVHPPQLPYKAGGSAVAWDIQIWEVEIPYMLEIENFDQVASKPWSF